MEQDIAHLNSRAISDLPLAYWEKLPLKDRTEFLQLRDSFHQNQRVSVKDRRLVTFSHEMEMVLKYTEKTEEQRENKCILIGIAFAGPFICVNTRQLKTFLGRCKSSINGSFQQLGYVALRTKSKARNCVVSVLPQLASEVNILRQWSVRCASEDAKFCYISHCVPSHLPTITSEDLFDERRQQPASQPQRSIQSSTSMQTIARHMSHFRPPQIPIGVPSFANRIPQIPKPAPPPLPPQHIIRNDCLEFDLPTQSELGLVDNNPIEMTPSFSVQCFTELNDYDNFDYTNTSAELYDIKWNDFGHVPRSKSAFFEGFDDYLFKE